MLSRFESLVRRGKASSGSDPSGAAATLAEALDLWRGPAFADLAEEPSLRGSIARMDELRLGATEHRIAAELAMGRHSTMVSELEALTARYPLRERLWAHLMLAMYRSGRQAEALDAFQRAQQVLQEELGADPSEELLDLNQQILRRDPELLGDETSAPPPSGRPSRGDLALGTSFAGYRIEAVLGRGGMSVVYLAEHLALGRKVALKLLAPQLADDDRFRERFVRESRIAAGMEHPNIVPIYEAGEAEDSLFIAMRYVPGTDLGTLIRREGTLDPERALWIVRETASALDAAHARGLVHRDVKPGNILVVPEEGSEGRDLVYLSDFGLTKRLRGRARRPHPDRAIRRNGRLRRSGADRGETCRRSRRHLRARVRPVRVPHRQGPLRTRDAGGRALRAPRRETAAAHRLASRPAGGDRRGRREGALEIARGPIRQLREVHDRCS